MQKPKKPATAWNELLSPDAPAPQVRDGARPARVDFRNVLSVMLQEAAATGQPCLAVRAADLHARVGGYPGRGHSMPTCCSAMREEMTSGDVVLCEPAGGTGAALHVRYALPR
ncbi:MAG: hypothetical protein NVSMB6_03380 [Burkholderiaceae bacterium]